jgi:hypothetical protein
LGVAGLFKGAAFVALCRIARELGLTGTRGAVASLYDRVAVALGCALVLVGAFTVLTGRWLRRSPGLVRPRWRGDGPCVRASSGSGTCVCCGPGSGAISWATFDGTPALFGFSVLALHLARRPLRPAGRPVE